MDIWIRCYQGSAVALIGLIQLRVGAAGCSQLAGSIAEDVSSVRVLAKMSLADKVRLF